MAEQSPLPANHAGLCASIIIPNYNGVGFLPVCLDALKAQSYPASWTEIIVVDDASTDGSAAFVREDYPQVRLVELARNGGMAVACNAGAAAAQGDLLVMLNNDTEAEAGWLAALVAAAQAHRRAGAIASKMLLYDRRDTLHNTGDVMGVDGIPRNRGVWQRDAGQYDTDIVVFGGCGGGVAYRREAWEAAGGFDERLFMYLEDVDLAWRLRLLGWEAVFAPEARLYHHLSATGGGALASYYTGRNTIWVIAKDMPGALIRQHFRRIAGAQGRVAWDALRAWRGEAARARLRGQAAGLLGLGKVLRWRRSVQAGRRVPIGEIERLLVCD